MRMRRRDKVISATSGGHKIVLDDCTELVEVHHRNGSVITIDAAGIITITATGALELRAPMVKVNSGTASFDGIVECDTLIARTGVVSPSYTPGAGNVQ